MTLSNMVLFLIFKSSPPYVSEPYNTFETFYIYQLIQNCCDVHALLVKMPGVNVSVNNGGGGLVKPGTTTNTCLMTISWKSATPNLSISSLVWSAYQRIRQIGGLEEMFTTRSTCQVLRAMFLWRFSARMIEFRRLCRLCDFWIRPMEVAGVLCAVREESGSSFVVAGIDVFCGYGTVGW